MAWSRNAGTKEPGQGAPAPPPAPEIPEQQSVLLVKAAENAGHLAVGTRIETKHPAELKRTEAVTRAYRLLHRSHPDDNPACWEEVE